MSIKSSRSIAPFGLRMPEELKSFIEYQSNANGRSMNAEVMSRLVSTITPGEFESFCDSLGDERDSQYDEMHDLFSALGFDSEKVETPDQALEAVYEVMKHIDRKIDKLSVQKDK